MRNILLTVAFVWIATGCLPGMIKPQGSQGGSNLQPSQMNTVSQQAPQQDPGSSAKPMVYPVDKQTFRFQLNDDLVWNSALDVLIRNYNLTIVDEKSGVITTEWDSFYLNGEVYRNKISIRLTRLGRNLVSISIHNNVEHLKSGDENLATSIWLPGEDKAGEVGRIIQNMAIVLGLPKPELPKGMYASSQAEE